MKRILLITILTVISTNAIAEWKLVDVGNNIVTYVDIATKRKVGGKVAIWSLFDYQSKQTLNKKEYLSTIAKTVYDCTYQTGTTIGMVFYTKNMQQGEVVSSFNLNPTEYETLEIAPNTVDWTLYNIACNVK